MPFRALISPPLAGLAAAQRLSFQRIRGRGLRTTAAALVLSGCSGRQSVLDPAGSDAQALFTLFVSLLVGAAILWVAMNGLFYWFTRRSTGTLPERSGRMLILFGGVIAPTVVIGAVLLWGLSLLPDQRAPGDGLTVSVLGEQWWWRVEYTMEGVEGSVVSANEIRLPTGQRTDLRLTSDGVIHSLWVPALGGKMDMFPGRETRMSLEPVEPGIYRGQCAEFCGASHAWMAFMAVAMMPEDFATWLEAEAQDAAEPQSDAARRGLAVFQAAGCGACHTVRGTPAVGKVGPDLTHVGSRLTIGAGRLGATLDNIER
ncbi:cytochrome c oxidase subunit 2 [Silicimonas algicola]|uniref:Cytochrome c oxidase subunit 2 n=1 Tax=Silicimonas algicola TaxID=1826607 RepID=A0A316G872_9RHOB|nr:cytochrome c oxidase subunit 2 [Silicimonas algicola]